MLDECRWNEIGVGLPRSPWEALGIVLFALVSAVGVAVVYLFLGDL